VLRGVEKGVERGVERVVARVGERSVVKRLKVLRGC
jgi:hypothetical protein